MVVVVGGAEAPGSNLPAFLFEGTRFSPLALICITLGAVLWTVTVGCLQAHGLKLGLWGRGGPFMLCGGGLSKARKTHIITKTIKGWIEKCFSNKMIYTH